MAARLLTVAQAAERLQISQQRVRWLIHNQPDRLPAQKVGRDWLIDEKHLARFERQRRSVGRPRSKR